jgi:LysR family transcriptional regulator, carnitine catabolism transcriptional activator
MDERRLRYFLAVAEEGGVTSAARRLHISQPSLSQALRTLEGELGAQLFDRAGRGIRLSAAGHAFMGPARQALRSIEAARNAVGEVSALLAGTLEIAALPTLAVDPLTNLVARFRNDHPRVGLYVREAESANHMSALVRDGDCELVLAHLPLPQEGLVSTELGLQEMLFVLPPSMDMPSERVGEDLPAAGAQRRAISPATLAEAPFVVSPAGTSTRTLLEGALDAAGVEGQAVVETDVREAIVPLVLAGVGAALLPAPLALDAERRGALVRAASPRITRRIGLVRRQGPLSPAARAFAAIAGAS